ncbi:MAG TPA: helix-turn-helix domain-containing protein [Pyrinomonadaceae bacterium]|nr:helix-turn-helix domain-containing protein [Pyrinomonadaceae bacterium]
MDEWLTTQQAADVLGVTAGRIRQMIVDKQLPTAKFGHVHMIKKSDLKLVENRKVGRPPKAKGETDSKRHTKKGNKK